MFIVFEGAQLYPATNTCTPSPLMCAVKRSKHEAIAFYLSRGFPLDMYKDMNWRTVLHVAVACADIQTVEIILEVLFFLYIYLFYGSSDRSSIWLKWIFE